MKKIIIGLVGEIASGKDVTKKYLEKNYGASAHKFSTILRGVLERLYLPTTRENLQDLSTILRQRFGEDLLAKIIARDVENDPREMVVVDGIRREEDVAYLKELPGFVLTSIEAAPELRYERLVKRNENEGDSEKTYEDFLADSRRESEARIPAVMAAAGYKLDNNGTLAGLYRQIEDLVIAWEKKDR